MDNHFLSEYVDLSSKKAALFSSITIDRFVEDEFRHDHFPIQTAENTSLASMSSGQQRKALLAYQIKQRPDYMLLDDVYSNIDKATQVSITDTLQELSKTTLLIQLFFRKRDLLPCMDTIFSVDEKNKIINIEDVETFIETHKVPHKGVHHFVLPELYKEIPDTVDPLVQLNNVSVHYLEKNVLDNVNWTIRKGEFWQLVGPNGAGKSTLISMITGDNPKAYGQNMVLFGRKKGTGETIWDIKRQIGYFTPAMIAQFTRDDSVENMIVSGLLDSVGLYVKPTDLQKDIAKSWIDMLGPAFKEKSFQKLSIGQQRMVMVARAMVKHPPLLILDEPTIELDDENSQLFIEMVNAIAAEKRVAILYVSHRDEDNLNPQHVFELIPTDKGCTGIVR